MLNKLKNIKITKNEIIMIVLIFIIIIIGLYNGTFAFFSTQKDTKISVSSKDTFGNTKVIKSNVILEGELSHTTNKTQGLNTSNTISIQLEDVTDYDYLVTLATQIDPHNTNFLEEVGSSIKYEVYHKTDTSIDTSTLSCESKKYTNGEIEDYCQTGTFENKLDGTPFDIMTNYKIKDTNIHYFDVYIYLSNESVGTSRLKTNFFFLSTPTDKPVPQYIESPDISGGLVPIKYDGTKWIVTTEDDPEWYNYDNQKWANAAILKNKDDTELILPDGDTITEADSNVYAMFVWVPRFSYTIGCTSSTSCYGYKVDKASNLSQATPGAIDIKFVDKETTETYTGDSPTYTYTSESDRNPTNYYTHPAFNFGSDKLSGIWVGKFETSTAVTATCYNSTSNNCVVGATEVRILPNVTSMRYQKIANQFAYSQYFSAKDNIYGLTGDAHMMKNSEWAAVAYLSQSIYGKYGNKAYSVGNKEIYINNYYNTSTDGYITGVSAGVPSTSSSNSITCRYNEEGDNRTDGTGLCGPGASSTGNIYGIYDMSGGAREYVMGNYGKISNGVFTGTVANSGIDFSKIDNKYYDKFTIGTPFTTKNTETIGQALYEVANWYGDQTDTLDSTYAWLNRGGGCDSGSAAGAFNGLTLDGFALNYFGFRSVFVMTST